MKKNKKESSIIPGSSNFDYSIFEQDAIKRLYEGDGLVGKDGVLTGMIQRIVNAALLGEVKGHIKDTRALGKENRRNGYTEKTLDTELGPVSISPPRDRDGSFEPQLVNKWSRQLGTGLDKQILTMYANGNSYGDIQHQLKSLYGLDYSPTSIVEVTEQVWPEVLAWQQRPLDSFYTVVFLDAMFFTSREGGKSVKKASYSLYGIDANGMRDVLGIYIREAEGAKEWGKILEDLRKRGVEDVLFFCVDGLTGFSDAILSEFPMSFVQRCIVHMIRSSTKLVADKNIKEVCADLRTIYTAADELQAKIALDVFKEKWDKKYPEVSKAWEQNWGELMLFMEFGEHTRRMIYTTNPVEALHRQIRKVTKTKGSWVNDKALYKQIYLTLQYGRKGWNRKVFNWNSINRELTERFKERFSSHAG
jgi:putative transposase